MFTPPTVPIERTTPPSQWHLERDDAGTPMGAGIVSGWSDQPFERTMRPEPPSG